MKQKDKLQQGLEWIAEHGKVSDVGMWIRDNYIPREKILKLIDDRKNELNKFITISHPHPEFDQTKKCALCLAIIKELSQLKKQIKRCEEE